MPHSHFIGAMIRFDIHIHPYFILVHDKLNKPRNDPGLVPVVFASWYLAFLDLI